MGGSQGASGLNEALLGALPFLLGQRLKWQFIHLTGSTQLEKVRQAYHQHGFVAVVEPFSQQMATLYSAADVVISRSGAASLTEISYYGLPSILIPFPQAADDHQSANALEFERAGASLVWPQQSLSAEAWAQALVAWVQNDAVLLNMSEAARALSVNNAAGCVADEVETCTKN